MLPDYAELQCLSNFSFLTGASHPEELVARAAQQGYRALALTDICSLAGIVRAHQEARRHDIRLIVGSQLWLPFPGVNPGDGRRLHDLHLVLLVLDQRGYEQLCQLISLGRRRADKGHYRLDWDDIPGHAEGLWALWVPDVELTACESMALSMADRLQQAFPGRCCLAGGQYLQGDDVHRRAVLETLSARSGLAVAAVGDVHMHSRGRRALQDLLTAIRLGLPLSEAGAALFPNGERHLRSRAELAALYPPAWLAKTVEIAEQCDFSLDRLRYECPLDDVPEGDSGDALLRREVEAGMARLWPDAIPERITRLVEHELAIISELAYAPYFLTVHDIVRFARGRGILCQGRGSAANSAVCYCLGITAVNPEHSEMLFERFISRERREPPDIDVDFEHERREEVIQYIYRRYGRERAALAASVITYRRRSAIRDVGRALGLSVDQVTRLAGNMARWESGIDVERIREAGLEPDSPVLRQLVSLVGQLLGFPRHLSQHVGGFVISRAPLSRLVPLENAAMPGRTVIQWDKDDLDALGLLKIDILALGMLSAIRRSFDLIARHRGWRPSLDSIPKEDPRVYAMIQKADTVGVFQIESRAQMSMLPRLKPACFYDLVIEVAIVRPGPIQGEMVHPYLRRRQGREAVSYPGPEVREVLERTLGVPLFQEQVIRLAMVAAGFSAGEADGLRRAIAAWRRKGHLEAFRERLLTGMTARGYAPEYAEQIYRQILGFGEYGFPESHAASFALLAYVSAWLKCHEPAAFTAALINSQPMGFYAPSQLIQDLRRHGVQVLPVDVRHSDWECTLEAAAGESLRQCDGATGPAADAKPDIPDEMALRLGLCLVRRLGEAAARRLMAARQQSAFTDVADLALRADLKRSDMAALAAAGALSGLSGHRHRSRWMALGVEEPLPLLAGAPIHESDPLLRVPDEGEDLVADHASLGLSLGRHPLALLREERDLGNLRTADQLQALGNRRRVRHLGLVVNRQHPASARGTVFMTLEDETGSVNVIVWPDQVERFRRPLLQARLLEVSGQWQHQDGVTHLIATRLVDRSRWLGSLNTRSRDFC